MSITVKKTLRLKKTEEEEAAEVAETVAAEDDSGNPPPAMITSAAPVVESSGSYTWAAICGIVAVLLLAGLLVVQFMEDTFFSTPMGN